jgi:hypothetical protein
MALEKVGADIRIKGARKAARDAKGVARGIDDIGDEARQASRKLTGLNAASGKLARGMGGLVRGAGYAAAAGGVMAVAFGVKSFRAFDEARKMAAQTEAVIQSTGGAANITAKEVGDLATAIQLKTGIDDESIRQGSNLLLTFRNIRNEAGKGNDVFNQATKAAVDLSAAGFGSISSASKMLGKALNDPVKGINAMSRAGVTFTEQQKSQIKTLVESGRTLEAQQIILKELGDQVGGSAEAQATPIMKLKTTIGDLQEEVGSGIAPTVDHFASLLNRMGRRILPGVGRAARRLGGVLRSENLDLGERLKFGLRALKQEIGPSVSPVLNALERELGKIDVGKAVTGAIEKGAPAMADALAKQVPNMASAFVTAFRSAGPGGQLLTVALLAAKFGAFKTVGTMVGGRFAGSFRMGAVTGIQADAAGGKYNKAGRAVGMALGPIAAAFMAKEVVDQLDGMIDKLKDGGGIEGLLGQGAGFLSDSVTGGLGKAWGNVIEDVDPVGRLNDARERARRNREMPGPASPTSRTGRIAPVGPLTIRGAQFALPGATSETVTEIAPVILDGAKVGELRIKRETRKLARK